MNCGGLSRSVTRNRTAPAPPLLLSRRKYKQAPTRFDMHGGARRRGESLLDIQGCRDCNPSTPRLGPLLWPRKRPVCARRKARGQHAETHNRITGSTPRLGLLRRRLSSRPPHGWRNDHDAPPLLSGSFHIQARRHEREGSRQTRTGCYDVNLWALYEAGEARRVSWIGRGGGCGDSEVNNTTVHAVCVRLVPQAPNPQSCSGAIGLRLSSIRGNGDVHPATVAPAPLSQALACGRSERPSRINFE